MKAVTLVGIVRILIGVMTLALQGLTLVTHAQGARVGPLEVTRETRQTIPLPPVLGALTLRGEISLVAVGTRRA